ncbi:MAG: LytR C-terminal domain-containing protein, partial [Mycobacterium sp.]|nr:LytR C-terminal domain-containing protein [Mycobacterium sp.]
AEVLNDTDINGLAAAVAEVLSAKGYITGTVANNEAAHVSTSQVRAAKADDVGAQAVSKDLGGLPVVADASVRPGSVRVVLANDYTGPGSGLGGRASTIASGASTGSSEETGSGEETAPPPSPILTAGSDNPQCVN